MADWKEQIQGALSKEDLIDAMQPRCYYFFKGAQGFKIVDWLNSAVMLAPRDLASSPRRQEWRKQKTEMAIQYPIEGEDWEVLRQISEMRPEEHHFKTYLAWGLYLYLAGVVTVYPNKSRNDGGSMTFLEACRASGFLDDNDHREPEEKLIQALKFLDLWERKDLNGDLFIQTLLLEWKQQGTFKVIGLPENDSPVTMVTEKGKTYKSSGSLLQLVRILCEPESPIMRTDNCISFLLAVHNEVSALPTSKERQETILDIILSASKSPNVAMRYVEQGDKTRLKRMLRAEEEAFSAHEAVELTPEQIQHSRTHFKKFLNMLPESTLKILYYTNQSLAHTEDGDLQNVMPKGKIPGVDDKEAKKSRESQGVYDARFKTIFAANGYHIEESKNPEQALLKKLMTTIHESFHIANSRDGANAYGDEFADLKDEYKQLGIETYAVCYNLMLKKPAVLQQKSPLLNKTYADILNPQSSFYENYNHGPIKGKLMLQVQEEILANILALSCTESKSPLIPTDKPDPELMDLHVLTKKVIDLYRRTADLLETRAVEKAQTEALVLT